MNNQSGNLSAIRPALLERHEPDPVWVESVAGTSSFLLTCDHAGRAIPSALHDLGVGAADLERHIACDIGIRGVAIALARRLDAVCIGQHYSRLVIDCNRDPTAAESILESSDGTIIPGNRGLSDEARQQRHSAIFAPYHERITSELNRRREQRRSTALVLLHSFTPVWEGWARPWQAGVLYHRDARLARSLRATLQTLTEPPLTVGDNQPYSGTDGSDYALNHYGEARGLPYVEIEIRQDLIAEPSGQQYWAELLGRALPVALDTLERR